MTARALRTAPRATSWCGGAAHGPRNPHAPNKVGQRALQGAGDALLELLNKFALANVLLSCSLTLGERAPGTTQLAGPALLRLLLQAAKPLVQAYTVARAQLRQEVGGPALDPRLRALCGLAVGPAASSLAPSAAAAAARAAEVYARADREHHQELLSLIVCVRGPRFHPRSLIAVTGPARELADIRAASRSPCTRTRTRTHTRTHTGPLGPLSFSPSPTPIPSPGLPPGAPDSLASPFAVRPLAAPTRAADPDACLSGGSIPPAAHARGPAGLRAGLPGRPAARAQIRRPQPGAPRCRPGRWRRLRGGAHSLRRTQCECARAGGNGAR